MDHSSYEAHPLGRTEWIRLYGVLTGKEKEAEAAFAKQEAALQRVTEEGSDAENAGGSVKTEQTAQAEKPSAAFFYITNQGSVNVRRSSDYIPKMIELAGGRYIFGHLGDDGKRSSTVNMQMEEFYAAAKESDYLIYNSTIDGEIHSISELLAKAPVLKDFKAVQAEMSGVRRRISIRNLCQLERCWKISMRFFSGSHKMGHICINCSREDGKCNKDR
ncbi:MAG: ABC transporter substrate-binding protein [Clostridium fessum]